MGDEDFTAEELEILGEGPGEEDEAGEGQESDQSAGGDGEDAGEEQDQDGVDSGDQDQDQDGDEGDVAEAEDDKPVPQARFNEVYGRQKEAERKLDLFKRLGPDEYYKIYPDEAPKDAGGRKTDDKTTIKEQDTDRVLSFTEAQNMVIDGGDYNGQTLGDLYKQNPIAAQDIYLNYRDEQRDAINQKTADKQASQQAIQNEVNTFGAGIAKQMFNKEVDALSDSEGKKVDEVITSVMDWMEQTGRWGYKLEDAFMIMSKDDLLTAAKSEGAKAIVNKLKGGSAPNVNANKGGGKKSGFEAYENMSRDDMAGKIERMSDAEFVKFSKSAPQSLKDKFSDVPWV